MTDAPTSGTVLAARQRLLDMIDGPPAWTEQFTAALDDLLQVAHECGQAAERQACR